MKLKLYLRGLGIGLLIGALALLIFGGVDIGKESESAQDSAAVLVTPVEEDNESKENEGALYATAYPLEASSASKTGDEISEEGKEVSKTIDDELTSTSDSISKEDSETEEAISQALSKSSDAKAAEQAGDTKKDADTAKTASDEIETEDGEAYAVTDDNSKKNTDTAANTGQADANKTDTSKTDTSKTDSSKTDTSKSGTTGSDTAAVGTDQTDANAADTTGSGTAPSDAAAPDQDTSAGETAGQSVLVQIPGGSDSASVCRVLQSAGAIDDAAAFDAYLVSRGLDRYIRSGTYYITAGSSYEEIAKLITGR